MRLVTLLGLVGVVVLASGCSAAEEEVGESGADALTIANNDFESTLAEIDAAYAKCAREGHCQSDGAGSNATGTGPRALEPVASLLPLARPTLRGSRLCDVLGPLAAFESPYFFAGASGNITAVKKLLDGGVDLVFDLRNQQAALFHYHNGGYSNLIGLEANIYTGYAFGKKANVLDAWSSEFQSAEATVELPFLNVGVGGSIFRSPDNSIMGGAVEATIGVNALGPYGIVEVSVSTGHWTPWDGATRAFGRSLWFVGWREGSARIHEKPHAYIQFNGAKDIGLALVQTFGVHGALPASQAAGLAALRSAGLTISQACPAR